MVTMNSPAQCVQWDGNRLDPTVYSSNRLNKEDRRDRRDKNTFFMYVKLLTIKKQVPFVKKNQGDNLQEDLEMSKIV